VANHGYLSRESQREAFGLTVLGEFRDLVHLSQLVRQVVREQLGLESQLFLWLEHLEVYRNWEREDVMAISAESPLIAYMGVENRIISTREYRVKSFFEESPELQIFFKTENIRYLLPVVYRFQVLGFVALEASEDFLLKGEQKLFCRLLRESLVNYVQTGMIMERRLQELLGMNYFTRELGSCSNREEVYRRFFELLNTLLPISAGVFYLYDEYHRYLEPVSVFSVEGATLLPEGKGISGFVFAKEKPLFVNDMGHQPFLVEYQKDEPFLKDALLILPLVQDSKRWGVLSLARYNGEYGSFSSDHLYLGRIIAQIVVTVLASKFYYDQLEQNYFATIKVLTRALEAKDSYTRGHSERVLEYVTWIASELNLSPTMIRNLQYAAVLHDIGKIGIDEHIIRKNNRLSNEEYEEIKHHPEIGEKILAPVDFLKEAREYVHYHHERLDGKGYYGKKAGEFPWETTIVILADIFDALTSDRPYRKASSYEEALAILEGEIGSTFDQKVYDALVGALTKRGLVKDKRVVSS